MGQVFFGGFDYAAQLLLKGNKLSTALALAGEGFLFLLLGLQNLIVIEQGH